MSSVTKILLGVLGLVIVALGAEAYLFFKPQLFPQTKRVASPATTSQITRGTTPYLSDITVSPVLLGYINIRDITKAQVGEWAKVQGPVSTPTYSGSIPIFFGGTTATFSGQVNTSTRPASVQVVAGYFKSWTTDKLVFQQSGRDISLAYGSSGHLWIKTGEKVQVVSTPLAELLASRKISDYMRVNDLALAPDVKEISGGFKFSSLIVFK